MAIQLVAFPAGVVVVGSVAFPAGVVVVGSVAFPAGVVVVGSSARVGVMLEFLSAEVVVSRLCFLIFSTVSLLHSTLLQQTCWQSLQSNNINHSIF